MRFESPLAFFLLLFIPFLIEGRNGELLLSSLKRGFKFSHTEKLNSISPSARTTLRAPLLSLLKVVAFIFLVTALARPQFGNTITKTKASGRDIVLALDVSRSMLALDFEVDSERVDRLTALKSAAKTFIKGRTGDRIGLVVFGTDAYTQCPLTLDHDVLETFIERMEIGMAGNGTAIGDAIALSLKKVEKFEGDSRTIVLVTDGETNSDQISPKQATAVAKELDIKIHTVGIGSNNPVPFPDTNIFGRTILRNQIIPFDEETLKEIATSTGGQYFNPRNTEELNKVYQEIDKLEERSEDVEQYIHYEERFLNFLLLGITFLSFSLLLSGTLFQVSGRA